MVKHAKYIDCEKLMQEKPEYLNPDYMGGSDYNKGWNAALNCMLDIIIKQPEADVVERKHGRWTPYKDGNWCCSICGDVFDPKDLEEADCKETCPNCGAHLQWAEENGAG